MISNPIRQMILCALFIALGTVFPFFFHMIGLGKVMLPMFWPIIVSGFFLAPLYAVIAGICTPLLSFILTGMPPMPILHLMMIELSVLALFTQQLVSRTALGAFWIVIIALSVSRIFSFAASWLAAPVLGLPPDLYAVGHLLSGVPGLLAIVILVPAIVNRVLHIPIFQRRHDVHRAS